MIDNEEESWRQESVNDNISDSLSPIPPTGSSIAPTGLPIPSSGTVSSVSKKRGRPTNSETKFWTDEEIEELTELWSRRENCSIQNTRTISIEEFVKKHFKLHDCYYK